MSAMLDREALMSPEERYFENARLLMLLRGTPSWKAMLGVLEARVVSAEIDMKKSASSDNALIAALQRRSRAMNELFNGFQVDTEEMVNDFLQHEKESKESAGLAQGDSHVENR